MDLGTGRLEADGELSEVTSLTTLFGAARRVELRGDEQSQGLFLRGCRERATGRGGADTIRDAPLADFPGIPTPTCDPASARFTGGPGRDELRGTAGKDRLLGGPGRDRAQGRGGVDVCRAERASGCERR